MRSSGDSHRSAVTRTGSSFNGAAVEIGVAGARGAAAALWAREGGITTKLVAARNRHRDGSFMVEGAWPKSDSRKKGRRAPNARVAAPAVSFVGMIRFRFEGSSS